MRARSRPLEVAVFGYAPLLFLSWLLWFVSGHGGGGDFAIFRHAGERVLHGHSPYVAPTAALLASNDRFVYPTPFAFPFVPFALVSERVGAVVFFLCAVVAVVVALKLLGVADRRCYGAAILSVPVFGALGVGAVGPFLLLLVAVGWRRRDRLSGGILLAVAAATKLFLWPLLVWLVVTRRLRGSAAAVATLVAIVGIWALADLHGLRLYPETVRVLNGVQRWKSYSPQTLALSLGLNARAAVAVIIVVGLGGTLAIIRARRDERRSFALAVIVALLATPILWLHYLVLLFVPLALLRPRLSPAWALPALLWVTPHPESLGNVWRIVLALAVVLVAAGLGGAPPAWTPLRSLLDHGRRSIPPRDPPAEMLRQARVDDHETGAERAAAAVQRVLKHPKLT
jgi:alpha-1,2-mannosyltransferase